MAPLKKTRDSMSLQIDIRGYPIMVIIRPVGLEGEL